MQTQNHIDSTNFYAGCIPRLVAKLTELGIAIPPKALQLHTPQRGVTPFSYIEHALMDWFDWRDFEQAQSLIHFRQAARSWCVATSAERPDRPSELSDRTISPNPVKALTGIILACDRAALRIDTCVKRGDSIVVMAKGEPLASIDPIEVQPFDLAIRDRVRTAFKGVRALNEETVKRRATRMPGIKGLAWRTPSGSRDAGCQLLGTPNGWAIAMRGALAQVEIPVKLSQAQELVAAYFGASCWHQLVKHQDQLNSGMFPIGVASAGRDAGTRHTYYWTPEEALFAVGKAAESGTIALRVEYMGIAFSSRFIVAAALAPAEVDLSTSDEKQEPAESIINCPADDYWFASEEASQAEAAATKLLERIVAASTRVHPEVSAVEVLYHGSGRLDVVKGIVARDGIPARNVLAARNCVCAVEYQTGGIGDASQVSVLHVFENTTDGVRRAHAISMYKAKSAIVESGIGYALTMRADYGRDQPVEVQFDDMKQLNEFMSLTHAEGLFFLVERPQLASTCA